MDHAHRSYQANGPVRPRGTDGFAICSLIFGLLGILCVLPGIGSLVAIITGHISMTRTRPGSGMGGRGMAITGLILGYLSFLVTLLVMTLYLAALIGVMNLPTKPSPQSVLDKEIRYEEVAMKALGTAIAEHYAGQNASAVVLVQAEQPAPGAPDLGDYQQRQLQALTEALTPQVTIRETIRLGEDELQQAQQQLDNWNQPGPVVTMPELRFTADEMDQIIGAVDPDVDVVISLIGLPADYRAMRYWRAAPHVDRRPRLVVAYQVALDDPVIQQAIENGSIITVLAFNPQGVYDSRAPVPASDQQAFGNRYLLINESNLQQMKTRYPEVFGP